MSAPSLRVVFELEAPIRVELHCMHEDEEVRLRDWITAHPEYVRLVNRAVAIFQTERAA